MKFCELLNEYIEQLSCSAKELSDISGLSNAVISRYRSGEREPAADSEQLIKICEGLSALARKRKLPKITSKSLLVKFQETLSKKANESNAFADKFSLITDLLQINMKSLSTYTNFETSYLYRIRSGQRHPNDQANFIDKLSRYIATHHFDLASRTAISKIIGCTPAELEDASFYSNQLQSWFSNENAVPPSSEDKQMSSFLTKVDTFDLDEYIRSIHFDELKVPTIPFYKPSSKHYYGVADMKKGELDFFKATVLSKSKEPIFMCSDMPMADMAEDMDFNKKWMFAIAMSLKKGLHLNIIHNIDRPFSEMMLGLEAWIPIYMTGQVSPYHLPNITTNIYHHFNYVSGSVALTGECIDGYHDNGKYYLTSNKEEVAYYKKKSANLLSKAKSLMDIYRSESKDKYHDFEAAFTAEAGTRHFMLSAPPIYTISDDLLDRILSRVSLSETEQIAIKKYVEERRTLAERTLAENQISARICHLSREEFQIHPVAISLSGMFRENEIGYTYDEYLEHFKLVEEYSASHDNFTYKLSDKLKFRNIQVQILEKKCIVISKEKAPTIHFVIRHRKMIDALYNFYLFES